MLQILCPPTARAAVAMPHTAALVPLGLAACFCLTLLPFAASFVTFHPDERHYTDGASAMVRSGDYFTPRTPEGRLRFNKPVATYWLLVPFYEVLGVSPWTGRIGFLLISAATIVLGYQLAQLAYGERRTSLLAAVILMTHGPLLSVAVNAIPEVPLTFCWLLCAYGLIGLVVLGKRQPLFYWATYGGAGLGMAVKGLPILLLVAFAFAFACLNPWRRTALRDLLHWPSMLSGAIVGVWWYAAMFALHGEQSLAMFMSDQVTERVGFSPANVLRNLALVIGAYATAFFPWSLPLCLQRLRRSATTTAVLASSDQREVTQRMLLAFVLAWAIVMGLVVALVERFALRYLLAVTPLAAVVLANHLAQLDRAWLAAWYRAARYVIAILIVVVTAAVLLVRLQLDPAPGELIGGAVICAAGLAICWSRSLYDRLAASGNEVFIAVCASLLLFPLTYLAIGPLALPDSGAVLADVLSRQRWLEHPKLVYAGSPALASKARVHLAGAAGLYTLTETQDLAIEEYEVVLVRQCDIADLPHQSYLPITEFAAGLENVRPLDFASAAVTGELKPYLAQHQRKYVFLLSSDAFPEPPSLVLK